MWPQKMRQVSVQLVILYLTNLKYYLSARRCGASHRTARLHIVEQMLCTPCPGSPHAHRHIVHISLIPSIIGKHVTHVLHKHMRLRTVSCPITHQRGFLEPSISSGEMSVMEAHVPPPSVSNHLMLSPIIRLIWRPSAWLIRTFLSCPYFWNVWISAAC